MQLRLPQVVLPLHAEPEVRVGPQRLGQSHGLGNQYRISTAECEDRSPGTRRTIRGGRGTFRHSTECNVPKSIDALCE